MKRIIGLFIIFTVLLGSFSVISATNDNNVVADRSVITTENSDLVIEEANNVKMVTVEHKLNSKDKVKEYMNKQGIEINKIIKNITDENISEMLSNAKVTLTFNNPISVDDLNMISEKYDMKLYDCEIKFLNDKQEWITGCVKGEALSDANIIQLQEGAKGSGDEVDLFYQGITSARVRMNLFEDSSKKVGKDKLIYLVDFADTIIRIDNSDYIGKLKIRVPDVAWEIVNK